MKYNVKISRYSSELQISHYMDGITKKDREETEIDEIIKETLKYNESCYIDTDKALDTFEQSNKAFAEEIINPFTNELVTLVEDFDSPKNVEDNLRRSVARTKQSIYEYSRANEWKWFVTFTFKDNIIRYDYEICKRKLSKWFNHFKERYCKDMYYLCVPEQHKDGAWHFHALINGSLNDYLIKVRSNEYTLSKYKLGTCLVEPVKDTNKVSMYIIKYITKDMLSGTKNLQRFFVSKGLNKAENEYFYLDQDENIIDFIQDKFPEFEITYSKYFETKSCYGHNCNYIQLGKTNIKKGE